MINIGTGIGCYYFNISGFVFILSEEKIKQYPDSLFGTIISPNVPKIIDRNGNIFIDRNPIFGKIMYELLIYDFKIRYLEMILKDMVAWDCDGGNDEDLLLEFKYYGIKPIFTDKIKYKIDSRFQIDDKATYKLSYNIYDPVYGNKITIKALYDRKFWSVTKSRFKENTDECVLAVFRKNLEIKINDQSIHYITKKMCFNKSSNTETKYYKFLSIVFDFGITIDINSENILGSIESQLESYIEKEKDGSCFCLYGYFMGMLTVEL